MFSRDPSPPQLKRALCQPLAAKVGVRYEYEMLQPGPSPAQNAFQFASCGADLLLALTYADGFPAMSKRVSRRGAKALVRWIGEEDSQLAAVFLAQALGTLLAEKTARAGRGDEAQLHRNFVELVQSHYPLSTEDLAALETSRAEYRTFETHEVRDAIRNRVELGTGYHRALLDPEFLDGRHPDDDPHMTETQESYAARYLRTTAQLHAIRMVLSDSEWQSIEKDLRRPGLMSYDAMAEEAGDNSVWNSVGDNWFNFANVAVGRSLPDQVELEYSLAEILRQRLEELLENAPHEPAEEVKTAFGQMGERLAKSETDWSVLTDAMYMGYRFRDVESEGGDALTVDPGTLSKLREMEAHEPQLALQGGALTVAKTLPRPFTGPQEIWFEVRAWACRESLRRGWFRVKGGMAEGAAPEVDEEACGEAFDLGYALRLCEQALYGGQVT